MPRLARMDFETYSEAGYVFKNDKWVGNGLQDVGAYVYANHPTTAVICLTYTFDNEPVRLWIPGMAPPVDLLVHISSQNIVEAHNASFEYYIWNMCLRPVYGHAWPRLRISQLRCSAAKARSNGLPGKLEKIPVALGSPEIKDPKGKRLITLLSCPTKPTKKRPINTRLTPDERPVEFADMYLYCIQDVQAERDISNRTLDISGTEQALWELDVKINCRGVAINYEALQGCIREYESIERKLTKRLKIITDEKVQTHNELKKLAEWLLTQGVTTDSLDAAQIKRLLSGSELPLNVTEALRIRQTLAFASVKKLYAINSRLDENNRIHDLYMFYGATRTGRFTGLGPQPQNLPREGTKEVYYDSLIREYADTGVAINKTRWGPKVVEQVLTDVNSGAGRPLMHWKDPVRAISGSLRGLFIAGRGYDLISSDFSAIEACVLAELAGEQWRHDVFVGHGKIYETSGFKITGVPFEEITKNHPARALGKTAELASGYGGWIDAWKNFGADKTMTDQEIKKAIIKWRKDSPAIVEFWGGQWRKDPYAWDFTAELYGLEGAAVQAILNPGTYQTYRSITYSVFNDVLYCQLPSGRYLMYRNPRMKIVTDRYSGRPIYQISFMGWNTNIKNGPVGWIRIYTYGGRLAENVTQAVARDIFILAMLRIDRHGKYKIVLHTHDEITAEVPEGTGDIAEFEGLMSQKEPWFASWPIKVAGGWIGKQNRK